MTHREGFRIQYRSVDWFVPTWAVYVITAAWIAVIVMLVVAYA